MKISAISYNQNNKHDYNSFKALRKITYENGFNPEVFIEDAKTVKNFLKNDAIINFCKEHDVVAELRHIYDQGVLNSLVLKIPKDEKFGISDDGCSLNLVFLHEDRNLSFDSFINKISKKDIKIEKNRVLKNIRQEINTEKEHKNLLNEISDLLAKHIKL